MSGMEKKTIGIFSFRDRLGLKYTIYVLGEIVVKV
jgi:hypothetical protein